jgi:hypothetical protein
MKKIFNPLDTVSQSTSAASHAVAAPNKHKNPRKGQLKKTKGNIFNPLALVPTSVSTSDLGPLLSESAFVNDKVGVCPKCNTAMGSAMIANGDSVYYCDKCRVSHPMPD